MWTWQNGCRCILDVGMRNVILNEWTQAAAAEKLGRLAVKGQSVLYNDLNGLVDTRRHKATIIKKAAPWWKMYACRWHQIITYTPHKYPHYFLNLVSLLWDRASIEPLALQIFYWWTKSSILLWVLISSLHRTGERLQTDGLVLAPSITASGQCHVIINHTTFI
jgi:hypothetical protein